MAIVTQEDYFDKSVDLILKQVHLSKSRLNRTVAFVCRRGTENTDRIYGWELAYGQGCSGEQL